MRTDDFIADLETQLARAAAGTLPRRRRPRPAAVLRPALVTALAAASAFAFVLTAGGGGDPERPVQPPPAPPAGAPFALEPASEGVCAADAGERPPREVLERLSVLRAPRTATEPRSDSPHARSPRADLPVTLVPMADVRSCVDMPPGPAEAVPGVCALVGGDEVRSVCFSLRQVVDLQAAAALDLGFLIAVLPDRVREATFLIGVERDTYGVTDNVVIANLEGAEAGARVQIVSGGGRSAPVCGDGQVLDTPLPGELEVAVPILSEGAARNAPDPVMDLLAKAGANRIWAAQARWVPVDEDSSVWVVPVVDSRFAECDVPTVTAPRAFEGPGACLVGIVRSDPRAAVCADLDDFLGFAMPDVPGGRLALGFVPHWARAGADVGGRRLANRGGFVAGLVPADAAPKAAYVGEGEPIHRIAVMGPEAELAQDRLAADHEAVDLRARQTDGGPTRVWYAPGMVRDASRIAELLSAGEVFPEVLPMDEKTRTFAGDDVDVLVLAGDDLRP